MSVKWTRLIQARKALGLKQAEMAQHCGVSMGTYSRWENLDFQPSLKQLRTISQVCGVSIDWLAYNDLFVLSTPEHMRGVLSVAREYESLQRANLVGYPEDCNPKTPAGLVAYATRKLGLNDYFTFDEVSRVFKSPPEDDVFAEKPDEDPK